MVIEDWVELGKGEGEGYSGYMMRSSVLRNEIQTLDQEIRNLHRNLDNAIVKKPHE